MLRRLVAVSLGLAMLAGCGGQGVEQAIGTDDTPQAESTAVSRGDAQTIFESLTDLAAAWSSKDCDKIAYLTTGAEATLGGRACEAARNGRAAPRFETYGDADFYLPAAGEDGLWFAALAHKPERAYFVFERVDGRWRLSSGPIPLVGEAPDVGNAALATGDDPDTGVRASLVPTRHVTYLTDPAGVSGVKFDDGDKMAGLLDELVREPVKVRPDKMTTDVRLAGDPRAVVLPSGGALVFHTLKLVFTQRPGPGRSSLAHPLYGKADIRAFTGDTPAAVTVTQMLELVTQINADNDMKTIALRRDLADITPK